MTTQTIDTDGETRLAPLYAERYWVQRTLRRAAAVSVGPLLAACPPATVAAEYVLSLGGRVDSTVKPEGINARGQVVGRV